MKKIILLLLLLPNLAFSQNNCDKPIISKRLESSPIVQATLKTIIQVENKGVGSCSLAFINYLDKLGVEKDQKGFLAAFYCTQAQINKPYNRQINISAICTGNDANTPLIPISIDFSYSDF